MANQVNPAPSEVRETNIVGSVRLMEIPFKVQVPVFENVTVKVPVFVDEQIKLPVGFEQMADEIALKMADKLMDKVLIVINARLDHAIDQRIKEIRYPKLVEELNVIRKDVQVEHPVFTDVKVDRPVFVDYEIKNPVVKDVEVINAVIADKTVINAVITDQKITNAIIKDVEVERAIIREKVIDVIHPRYLKPNGEPE